MTYPQAPADVLKFYRDLHAHPELSGNEHRTQAAVHSALATTASQIRSCGGTGLEAVLRNGPGPVVGFRADMDALPLQENTGLPYASTNDGVMHACGHDVHTASLVGAMRWLDSHREAWSGTLVGIFQPAEETGAGALAMLDDGLFDTTGRPDVILGQHVTSAPLGKLLIKPGWFLAGQRAWRVSVTGTGGHASRPHLANEALLTAVAMVNRLQTVTSREIDPFRMAVLTVATFHAGTKENVIPAEAVFTVSARAYEPEVAAKLEAALLRILHGEAAAGGVEVDIREISHLPAVYNDPAENARAATALHEVFGEQPETPDPLPASDDFSRYAERLKVPSVIWNFGVHDPALPQNAVARNHDARFAPHPTGAVSVGLAGAIAVLTARLQDRDLDTENPN
ncbi:M20 metallopeptidase family protein [Kineosporia babensis]|uniref:Amidohydrolase n=1 Tax=Kineosporia babensis TaxID=499548 RepID=A0A9X1NHH8_9ACTN|nr:amidohydrolase [Kineosporia babensis]MCD5313654.1 amidohydrolase [Kineosporia babensis]